MHAQDCPLQAESGVADMQVECWEGKVPSSLWPLGCSPQKQQPAAPKLTQAETGGSVTQQKALAYHVHVPLNWA